MNPESSQKSCLAGVSTKCTDISIDEAAALHWPEDVEDRTKMVMPGDNVEMLCDIYNPIAVENGQRFNIREGGRTVATGLVTRVVK